MPIILSKIKEFVKAHEGEIILAAGVILVSLISFAAGYLAAREQLKEPIRIEKSEIQSTKSETNSNE